jgi:DmsE family decaheme c-type cytochrome
MTTAKAMAAALLVTAGFITVPPFPAQEAPAAASEQPKQAEPPNTAEPPSKAEYMTSVVCQGCHDEIYNTFFKQNAHRILETDAGRKWQEKACESCHGPGSIHAETAAATDILNPSKVRPARADRVCLDCHRNQQTQAGRIMSGHARSQVRCTSCHSVHAPQQSRQQMRTSQCGNCHTDTLAEFQRPHRHRLPEGAMTCVDCHNPHGGTNRSMWQNVSMREPGCFRCHGDKRGPFTFEHAPMRLEGCVACHEPHGSANPRMMTRHEVRNQCLECHTNLATVAGSAVAGKADLGGIPPAFHDLRSPRFRNCTTCHNKIHGSYVDRAFTR